MSDQWGQSYQPQQPQNPYGQQPQGPYNQPANPYGQPVQPAQGPYGEAPQPGPYGPGQPQGPYGQPQPTPFGQPPTMQPMQQPMQPMQPITPQNPYGQPYGFPQQSAPPAGNKNRSMVISGAVVLVLIVAGVVFFATKGSGSGSHSGGGGVNASSTGGTSVVANGQSGTRTQAQSCAAVKSLRSTMDSQDPNSEADTISALAQDVPQMQTIADDAQSGTFKSQMEKVAADFNALESYMKANPGLDTSSETPPTQFVSIAESIDTDLSAVDTTCGISDDSDSGSGDSGF